AAALNNLGMLADDRNDHATARAHYELAAEIYRDLQDRAHLGMVLANLGTTLLGMNDLVAAEAASREFLKLAQETADPWCTATALHNLGETALKRGDYEKAGELLRRAAPALADLGDVPQVLQVLLACGRVAAWKREAELAVTLFGAVESIQSAESIFLSENDLAELRDAKARARADVSSEEFDAAWNRGTALEIPQAVQLGLTI
ncbi:MAG TPA: tetratricopeptide repeat protein, partial [Chthonomonadales bacterium]|nr:tetratricopeptide repeat protein [Chthonomonadales bacterium]